MPRKKHVKQLATRQCSNDSLSIKPRPNSSRLETLRQPHLPPALNGDAVMTQAHRTGRWFIRSLLALTLFLGVTALAHAAPAAPSAGILDNVVRTFHDATQTWGAKATGYAENIFLGLAVIGLIWDCGWLALQREDIGAFFTTFIRWLLFVGFFWWLTQHAAAMASAIFGSFQQMGGDIGGLTQSLGPSTPLDVAYQIDVATGNAQSIVHPINSVALAMVDLTIMIAMCVVAANMVITLCTAWIMAYAGCVLVGFGALRWTSDIAINYFRTVLGVAVTYMTMLLLVGLAKTVFNFLLVQVSSGTTTMQSLMVMVSVALVLAFIIHKVPPLVGSITGNNGGAHGSFGMGAAIGALAGIGIAAATGGAALAAGATGAAAGSTGSGSLGPMMAAVNAGSDAGSGLDGSGADLADTMSAANDNSRGAEDSASLAAAMGDGPRQPSSSGGRGTSFGRRAAATGSAVGTVAMAVAHSSVHAMDQAVGGSGYQGQLAPVRSGTMAARVAAWNAARDPAIDPALTPRADADSSAQPHIEESDIPSNVADYASNDSKQPNK
ncbi:P-type conjugative transfer protein TrbL [Rhodanobacter sp. DHB23]|uniref:P-type conjugative transfer protein TrbL n=1 Tax=Rhodanobacter sp. DHB23 TaxID=2775923 RepID=UPI00177E81C1|nr:P-type conjugative transfer protein TrbL [Rhodanobacter sp. DHB23]MBD8872878.1 P-type conjugative transfer protein TrbL [Rhodanobacter sp. DHB23]